jgi:PAS domain S-box-containing protein
MVVATLCLVVVPRLAGAEAILGGRGDCCAADHAAAPMWAPGHGADGLRRGSRTFDGHVLPDVRRYGRSQSTARRPCSCPIVVIHPSMVRCGSNPVVKRAQLLLADHSLLQVLPVACATTDAAGLLTFFNDAAAELWGDRPEVRRCSWHDACRLVRPDGRKVARSACPVERVLETGQGVRREEAVVERADGRRVPVLVYVGPQRDAAARLTGTIALLVDVADRTFEEIELERLAAVVASSDDAIISKTLDGRITSWNAGATRIFGYAPEEMIGQPITSIIPSEMRQDEDDILARLRRGEHIDHFDTVRVAKDGRRVDISLTVSPLRDRTGTIVGASKVARDISDRRRHEEVQRRLIDELNHRVKNNLAIIQALANQSLRRAVRPADFVASFNSRIHALAQVHDLLVKQMMLGVDVAELVREMVVRGFPDVHRITCAGPTVALHARTAVQLGLVLHELAANARRHGALSVAGGTLSIAWTLRQEAVRSLDITWRESCLKGLRPPARDGFGRTLIDDLLKANAGAAIVHYGADGLDCRITMPLPSNGAGARDDAQKGQVAERLAAAGAGDGPAC